jgi:hypothetical protein
MRRGAFAACLGLVATLGVSTLAAAPDDKAKTKSRNAATATAPAPRSAVVDAGATPDAAADAAHGARPVRVRLLDGSTVSGTVHAEESQALVIDCSLGLLAIPRGRISTIAYDGAAEVGQKRAPVQMLDDDGPPPKKRTSAP